MEFSVVFWNTWLNNQLGGQKSARRLLLALDQLIADYEPDCFGLSEVLSSRATGKPFLLEHLKKQGYKYLYYAVSGRWTNKWDIGVGIASKYPLEQIEDINLGGHLTSRGMERSGTSRAKALSAKVCLTKDASIDIIVAHLMHLRVKHLDVHFQHQKNLNRFITKKAESQNLIVGGDFNEPATMPASFVRRNKRRLDARTGTFTNPTWFNRANQRSLLRANPDKILWTRSGSLKLKRFQIVPEAVSDHRPLYARFSLTNKLNF